MVTTRPPKTIVKPTALGPVANTDTKLLIYGLFQKGRVLAQDGSGKVASPLSFTARFLRQRPLLQHREVKILMRLPVGKVQTADPMGVRIF